MKLTQAQNYIQAAGSLGIVPGLETIRALLEELGNPQRELSFIHIAGTNGKGSVGAYLAYILAAAGYRVGRYLSPAVFDECEKIQVIECRRKENICEAEPEFFVSYIQKEAMDVHVNMIKAAVQRMLQRGQARPTVFEIETAMAFLELREKNCDLVVLEVGMGGRLDATNLVERVKCSVITPISMDHMGFLGNTLKEIAWQKAGIIKEGGKVVASPQEREAADVLWQEAQKKEAEIFFVDEGKARQIVHSFDGIDFIYVLDEDDNRYEEKETSLENRELSIHLPLLGMNQVENALTALETVQVLKNQGYLITKEAIKIGCSHTVWRGRFEVIRKDPMVILDGAHNEAAAQKLAESLKTYVHGRLIYVFGIFKDKEVEKVIEKTAGLAEVIFTVTPDSPRALSSKELKEKVAVFWNQIGKKGKLKDCGDVKNGVKEALKYAEKEDTIVVFGSLSLLSEIYKE